MYGLDPDSPNHLTRKDNFVSKNDLTVIKKDSVVDEWKPAESAMKMVSKSTLLNFDEDEPAMNISSP